VLLCIAAPLPWLTAAPLAAQAPTPIAPGTTVLSVASANVLYSNHDAQPLVRWVAAPRPDALVVLELSAPFAAGLPGADVYPYRSVEPRGNEFGLAVLSRYPLLNTRVVTGADGIPQIETEVQLPGQRISFVAMHPMPPLTPAFRASLNHKLQTVAAAGQASTLPAIVAGDLNATPWSSSFAGLAALGLRRSTPLAPTWPAAWRGWMGIPIDHVLVSPHWAVLGAERGPDVGSDHLPVLVRLALVAPEPAR
jgi:endonuclease/exonuclease/phosphatase (EEP) superfamily protein YafD